METRSTGLVPPAPAIGAQLIAQASELRPIGAGFQWTYAGFDYTSRNPDDTTVTHAATTDGVVERDASTLTGVNSQRVYVDGSTGSVVNVVDFLFAANAAAIPITAPELRSPVKSNDQWTLWEGRLNASGIDVDADGKVDPVDIAIWQVVVGADSTSLPNKSLPLATIRVDTFLAAKVFPTSSASPPQVFNSQVMTWYAPGIGIVREAIAASDSSRPYDSDRLLLGFDGITSGWGYTTQPSLRTSNGATVRGGSMVQLADGVLVDVGFEVIKLDKNGRVVSRKANTSANGLSDSKLTPLGLRQIQQSDLQLRIQELDNMGVPTSASPAIATLSGSGPSGSFESPVATKWSPSGDRAWVAWQRSYSVAGNPTTEVVLRAVGLDGTLLTPERTLTVSPANVFTSLHIQPLSDGALAVLRETDTSNVVSTRWLVLNNNGSVVNSRMSASWIASFSTILGDDSGNLWALWSGPSNLVESAEAPHGIRIDSLSNFVATPDTSAALLTSTMSQLDADVQPSWPRYVVASENRWFATGEGSGLAYPWSALTSRRLTFVEYDPGANSPAGGIREVSRVHLPYGMTGGGGVTPSIFVFPDRVLLLTDKLGELTPTVVWR